ncbi:hypothetical protein [Methylobacterium sp. J-070]|uniref:hypothetical protein n=1 Tax=Methylobacterium sp. J-070 TaxID=2836650 RepID=UPI001FBBA268|nr:hypothetical protein [Methylobacterium sp. J-070]MCJ2052360.1 hypothetical protein [Methylobacterium sp. J-070]
MTVPSLPAQLSNSYGNIANALGAVKQQQQGQKGSVGMKLAQPYRSQPIGLQQARAMFDPSQFFTMLRQHGVKA